MNEGLNSNSRVVAVADAAEMGSKSAEQFCEIAVASVAEHGDFRVALSGGNTPRALYSALLSDPLRTQVPWEHTQVFFSDERFVPPDSDQSNFHTAQTALLSSVPIPERQVHRVATVDITPEQSAELYEEGIRRICHTDAIDIPAFDLILLGLGPDGHTASLFPATAALNETERLVVPNYVDSMQTWRITFTYRLLNAARTVFFLVQGQDKRGPLAEVLSGRSGLPAAGVRPTTGEIVWFVDRAAYPRAGE